MKSAVVLLVLALLPVPVSAQLVPGRHQIMMQVGPTFATNKLLKTTASYPTHRREGDQFHAVVTDIKLDPGVFTGLRYSYNLTRRLAIDAEWDFAIAVFAVRQLEIQPEQTGQPQYETTTTDAHIRQLFLDMSYFFGSIGAASPYITFGIGDHNLDLRQKGAINPDPIHDRAFMAGLGVDFIPTDRLQVRFEVRNYMYNFAFDNQFVDPVLSRQILFRREELYNTTRVAGPRQQNDVAVTLGFMVRPF